MLIGVWVVSPTAELFDPATGLFTPAGTLNSGRSAHTATLLGNGQIFVAGGETFGPNGSAISSTELFDPISGISTLGPALSVTRSHHTATGIVHGPVLIAGGEDNSAELYWSDGAPITVGSLRVASIPLAWGYNWNGFFGGPCNANWYTAGTNFNNDFTLSELRIPNHNNGYSGGFFIFEDSPSILYASSTNSIVNFGDGVAKFFFASPLIRAGHTYYFDGVHVGPPGNDFFTGGLDNCGPSVWDFYSALPSITAISPSHGTQGQTLSLTVTGYNFNSGDKLSFSSTAITISGSPLITSPQIVASVTVSINASPGPYDAIVTNVDGRQVTLPGAFFVDPILPLAPPNGFLSFPLSKLMPNTAGITSVFDHHVRPDPQSGAPLFYKNDLDGVIVDYGGEEGLLSIGTDGSSCCPSYSNVDRKKIGKSKPFLVTGVDKLSYDGHAGYDFVYNSNTFQQPILAPADGILFIPEQDPITLHGNPTGAPESFAIMAIDHGNGFVTWYLHVGCKVGTTDGKKILCSVTDDNDYRGRTDPTTDERVCSTDVLRNSGCMVHRGDVIGLAGNMGLAANTAISHIHFEVRIGLSVRSNGLPGCDLPLCRPVDPYGWSPAADSPVQVDPYSQYLGGAKTVPLWLR